MTAVSLPTRRQRVSFGGFRRLGICLGSLALLGHAALAGAAQAQAEREPATYTAEQADAGFDAYTQHCASCHGANLDDGSFAPPLKGGAFQETWRPRSLEALFTVTSTTMPEDRPASSGN